MVKNGSSILATGLAIGFGAGVVIGMLLAPKSGRETRKAIRKSATEGEEYLEQRGAEFRDTLNDLIKAAARHRDRLTAAIEAAKEAYRKTDKTVTAEPAPAPDLGVRAEG